MATLGLEQAARLLARDLRAHPSGFPDPTLARSAIEAVVAPVDTLSLVERDEDELWISGR